MSNLFEIAGGTVAGRDHVRIGKNSHDAYSWFHKDLIVAVVCDGCGSGEHSEVGAKIGAKIVVDQVLRHYRAEPGSFPYATMKNPGLGNVQRSILINIQSIAEAMAGSFSKNVSDYFLFTIIGVLLDPKEGQAFIFGCGDGIFYVNDVPTTLPSLNNAPPYLAYNLVETNRPMPELGMFWMGSIDTVKSILLGTDGVADLVRSSDKPIPGREEKIGPISQFWEKDGFFKNPFSIGHKLALINRSISKVDWEKKAMSEAHGPLHDDTTLVTIRRKKHA
jgi:hypothetical protein